MKRNLFILSIVVLFFNACAPAASSPQAPSISVAPAVAGGAPELQKSVNVPAAPQANFANDSATGSGASSGANPGAKPAQDRVVIQNVDMSIVVKDPQAKMTEIGALARRLGGFVVSSNMNMVSLGDNLKVPEGTIAIRVPAKDLDTALAEIIANVVEVQTENRSGQDVTDQYVDLQSQLRAKQAAADKLYEIMQKTEKADETLLVFNQLTQVQSEVEVLKGQINYFEQAAALSAISVRLVAEQSAQPIVIAGWHPQGVAREAAQALIDFFQNFGTFLIWLVIYILPVGAVLIVLLALLWRLLRWFWRKVFPRKTPAPAPAVKPE